MSDQRALCIRGAADHPDHYGTSLASGAAIRVRNKHVDGVRIHLMSSEFKLQLALSVAVNVRGKLKLEL
jgi:hypothetical protein